MAIVLGPTALPAAFRVYENGERTSLHISQLHWSDLMNILTKGSADFRHPQEL